jgi:Family of unknown function (DUF6603)
MAVSLERVADEAISVLAPFPSYFATPDSAVETFRRLGYEAAVNAFVPVAADIARISDGVNKLVDLGEEFSAGRAAGTAGLAELLKLIGEIGLVVADVRTLPPKLAALNLSPEFFKDFAGLFFVDYLEQKQPVLLAMLELTGVLDRHRIPVVGAAAGITFTKIEFDWKRLGDLVQDPNQWAQDMYGWGTPLFDHALLLLRVSAVFDACGLFAPVAEIPDTILSRFLPSAVGSPSRPQALQLPLYRVGELPGATAEVGLLGLPVEGKTAPAGQDIGIGLIPYANGAIEGTIPITPVLELVFAGSASIAGGIVGAIRPQSGLSLTVDSGDIAASGKLRLELGFKPELPATAVILLGEPDSLRLDAQRVFVAGGVSMLNLTPDFLIETGITGGRIVIQLSEADGFLAKVLPPDGIQLKFSFRVGWSHSKGIYFEGSGGLETTLVLNTTLGPIVLQSIWIGLSITGTGLTLGLGVTCKLEIGPVVAAVDRIGLNALLAFKDGNLGPVNVGFGFMPPTGLGVAIDAGPVSGGGYVSFDEPNHRYSGILHLEILSVSVTVIGLVETKLPDGRDGYSFLLIVCVEFSPIQLGYGFTLNGVGGLAGIHRSMNLDALRTGVYTGSLDYILFPKDPVAHAAQLISDLSRIFPVAEGRFTFGPMAKLGWGAGIIEISLGIIIELPLPIRIALLGQIAAYLPQPKKAVVELHIDFVASIDFEAKLFALDATLRDSRIVVFTLTGDIAMRLSWGQQPNFALAMGGFHPHFLPPPGFPVLRRLTLAVGEGDTIRLNCQTYQAVTSNSVQVGARLELYVDVGVFIHGWFGFDALFIFSPFSFQVDFSAGLEVAVGGVRLASITVDGSLSGPTPWRITGSAKISLLFFEITAHVDHTFGQREAASLPQLDPWPDLLAAATDARNWTAVLAPGVLPVVTLAAGKNDQTTLVDPVGSISWLQHVAPLDRRLTRYQAAPTPAPVTFTVDRVVVGTTALPAPTIDDSFSAGQFEDLSDDQKLSRPSFERMHAGVKLTSSTVRSGPSVPAPVSYETSLIDSIEQTRKTKPYALPLRVQLAHAAGSAAARSALRNGGTRAFAGTSKLAGADELFEIASTDDLTPRPDIAPATTKGAAFHALEAYLAANPGERGALQVVPSAELADG